MVKQLPSMQQLVSSQDASMLESVCQEQGAYAFELFNWIVSSNNCYIVSLQGEHRIQSMGKYYMGLYFCFRKVVGDTSYHLNRMLAFFRYSLSIFIAISES